jgi:hypothetical protein
MTEKKLVWLVISVLAINLVFIVSGKVPILAIGLSGLFAGALTLWLAYLRLNAFDRILDIIIGFGIIALSFILLTMAI